MFNPVEAESPSFVRWLVQLFGAALIPLVVLLFAVSKISTDRFALDYLIIAATSCALAVGAYHWSPAFVLEGTRVWILPTCVELTFALVALKGGIGLIDLIYVAPGQGERGWGILFLTWPTFGCCVYSMTMWMQYRLDRNRKHGGI